MTDEAEMMKRAMRNYFRRFGAGAPIPANTSEVVEIGGESVAVLRNINGELARFKLDRSGRLRYLAPLRRAA